MNSGQSVRDSISRFCKEEITIYNLILLNYVASKATPRPRPKSSHGLFLGDLSIFCCEKDIENAFAKYGHILSVRIQRSKEDARALSYGFIEFASETAAVTAMNEMNGFVLIGRPLR